MSRRSRIGELSWRRWCSSEPSGARPRRCGLVRVVILFDEMELECCRRAEHALRRRRILDAGQLDEDAVEALALHDGFGDAELVDAVAQRHRFCWIAKSWRSRIADSVSCTLNPGRPSI